jgi:hypothetical protein
MALVSTVAGSDSDSYISLEDAELYFADHWQTSKRTAWLDLTEGQKERVLRTATNILESINVLDNEYGGSRMLLPAALRDEFTMFRGEVMRYDAAQRLNFPRNVDISLDVYQPYIPISVEEALCEQAVYMLSLNEDALTAQMLGYRSQEATAGSVSSIERYTGGGQLFAPMAVALMKPFIRRTRKLARG